MIGDKYKYNYSDYIVKVIFEDGEGKLLEHISGTNIGFKFYALNSFLESSFTLIKEPRKTKKKYGLIMESRADGNLVVINRLYPSRREAETAANVYVYYDLHDILEIEYTEKV